MKGPYYEVWAYLHVLQCICSLDQAEKRVTLPATYFIEMKMFLDSYKKEVASRKKWRGCWWKQYGSFYFPTLLPDCNWFIKQNNLFSWLLIIFQWNCMARSKSIDHIGFTNMKRRTDSIVVKYNESKSDKAGERCTNKNICM